MLGMAGLVVAAVIVALTAGSEGRNEAFRPQDEFRLEPWIELRFAGIDLSVNRAVLYLLLASVATIGVMVWIARRMQDRPNGGADAHGGLLRPDPQPHRGRDITRKEDAERVEPSRDWGLALTQPDSGRSSAIARPPSRAKRSPGSQTPDAAKPRSSRMVRSCSPVAFARAASGDNAARAAPRIGRARSTADARHDRPASR